MKHPVIFTTEALADYHDILLYGINEWGADAAAEYRGRLDEVVDSIGHFPQMSPRKENVQHGIRVASAGQHKIYYLIEKSTIRIIRILHSRMDETHYLDIS
jgi:toxin ParE1/3/4